MRLRFAIAGTLGGRCRVRRKTLARAAGCLLAAALTFSAAGPAVAEDLPTTPRSPRRVLGRPGGSAQRGSRPTSRTGTGNDGPGCRYRRTCTAWRSPACQRRTSGSLAGSQVPTTDRAWCTAGTAAPGSACFEESILARSSPSGRRTVFVQLGSGRLPRWNGSTWTAYPNPYGRGKLAAVGTQLWRIENATVDRRPNRLIVQRWTGSAWRTMTSPHPVVVADADLSASSPRNVLVEIMNVRRQDARLLRWNARVWSRAELSLRLAGEPPRCGRRRHRQRLDRCRHCPVVGWQVAGC